MREQTLNNLLSVISTAVIIVLLVFVVITPIEQKYLDGQTIFGVIKIDSRANLAEALAAFFGVIGGAVGMAIMEKE